MHALSDPTYSYTWSGGGGLIWYAAFVIGLWGMLHKAGMPGWGAIIPIYNVYLIARLGRVSGVSILLLLIPIVNIFYVFYLAGAVSDAFGHGLLMAVFGLVIFAPLGFLILGLGGSRYVFARFDQPVGENRA